MAVSVLRREVSDLCLGKPPLRGLPISATVADALSALKRSGDNYVSVWSCEHSPARTTKSDSEIGDCRCVGKVCIVDVVCFLCREDNLLRPAIALQSPVSDLLPKVPGLVKHLEPQTSLLEAIDLIVNGVQNLVVPIERNISINARKKLLNKPSSFGFGSSFHGGREFCWLTQEDVMRFILNSIGIFSPMPTLTVESLDIISTDIMTVHYREPASSLLANISQSLRNQTSIAVVDDENRLIGEISPISLAWCEETVAAAIATLSAGELMTFVECGGSSGDLVQVVKERLEKKKLGEMVKLIEELSTPSMSSSSSCSSDDEFGSVKSGGSGRYSCSDTIVCYSYNSLAAVMIQALTHRVNYVWVVEDDYTLVGIVTFARMLEVFRTVASNLHKGERVYSFKK